MKEVINYLEDIKEDWDYCNICDSYFDITDDVYYWLFIFIIMSYLRVFSSQS